MDLFDELENLAVNAAYEEPEENDDSSNPSHGTIKMWQERFGYTYDEAAKLVGITETIKKSPTTAQRTSMSPAQARTIYAIKLEGPISTPHQIQIAADLPTIPALYSGSGKEGTANFCKVDGRAKANIEHWLSTQKDTDFRPLFVPEGKAYKELSYSSLYPTLGKDATLPQFRPQAPHLHEEFASFGRANDQYPVWYFFYGTLASGPKLRSLLSLPEDETPVLHEASLFGGKMKTWGRGKYNALVDGLDSSRVVGSAYQVMSEEHEDALRKYETSAYEVVRCSIEMAGTIVEGCTFRFVGETD